MWNTMSWILVHKILTASMTIKSCHNSRGFRGFRNFQKSNRTRNYTKSRTIVRKILILNPITILAFKTFRKSRESYSNLYSKLHEVSYCQIPSKATWMLQILQFLWFSKQLRLSRLLRRSRFSRFYQNHIGNDSNLIVKYIRYRFEAEFERDLKRFTVESHR